MEANHRWVMFCPDTKSIDFHDHKAEDLKPGKDYIGGDGKMMLTDVYYCPATMAPVFFSEEVGLRLLSMYPEAPFVAVYQDLPDGKRTWVLQARANYDCSQLAAAYGGQRHKGSNVNSAGFITRQ